MIPNCAYRVSLLAMMAHAVGAEEAANAQKYTNYAVSGIKSLNDHWYNVKTGIWDDAWWNSGNALTTLADFAALRLTEANKLNVGGYMRNTFVQAQKVNVKTAKFVNKAGMVSSVYCLDGSSGCMAKREFWASVALTILSTTFTIMRDGGLWLFIQLLRCFWR